MPHGNATGEYLAGLLEGLSALDDDRSLLTDSERIDAVALALQAAGRLQTLAVTLLHEGRDLARFTRLRSGCLGGAVSPQQSRAFARVLTKLPDGLGPAVEGAAEATMVGYRAEFGPVAAAG